MKRKINTFLMLSIVFVVALTTIGYSVLNRELKITGELAYKGPADIRITNVKLDSINSGREIFTPNFSTDEIILGYNLDNDASSITYRVEVTNFSNTDMGILKIEGADNLELDGYILKTKLQDAEGNSKAGMIKEFTITLKGIGSYNTRLKLDFEQVYSISYKYLPIKSNLPKEILNNDTLIIEFKDYIPKNITLKRGDSLNNDFVYSNNKLIIPDIKNSIEIIGIEIPEYLESCKANTPILNGNMISVVYSSELNGWIKQDLNKTYNYCDQIWANAVTIYEDSIKDYSGNNINASIHGATVSHGEAYFDGIDDYIDCGLDNYDFKDSFSIKIHFKIHEYPIENNTSYLIGNANNGGFYLTVSSLKKIKFAIHDGNDYIRLESNEIINLDTWYDLIAVFDGKNIIIYLNSGDGYKKTFYQLPQSCNMSISSLPIVMGANPEENNKFTEYGNINVKEIKLYDRVITEDEVKIDAINDDWLLFDYQFDDILKRDYYKNSLPGTLIPMNLINTMWVWIPRYNYTIKSENGTNYYGKATLENPNPTKELPGAIDINFVSSSVNEENIAKYTGNNPENFRTNDAFNFDSLKNGFWVGKFQTTGIMEGNVCLDENCDASKITIKPNQKTLTNLKMGFQFYTSRSMQKKGFGFDYNKGDLHVIKNTEWGAIAYLSQSIYGKFGNSNYSGANKQIYQNRDGNYLTGASNGSPSLGDNLTKQYIYNDLTNLGEGRGQAGPGASTTGNIYGVYDMNGGAWEYVMGILAYTDGLPMSGTSMAYNSGFPGYVYGEGKYQDFSSESLLKLPDKIYYDLYLFETLPTTLALYNSENACNGYCYSQALLETKGWYNNYQGFVYREKPWMLRGGHSSLSTSGIFYSSSADGDSRGNSRTRYVLSQ